MSDLDDYLRGIAASVHDSLAASTRTEETLAIHDVLLDVTTGIATRMRTEAGGHFYLWPSYNARISRQERVRLSLSVPGKGGVDYGIGISDAGEPFRTCASTEYFRRLLDPTVTRRVQPGSTHGWISHRTPVKLSTRRLKYLLVTTLADGYLAQAKERLGPAALVVPLSQDVMPTAGRIMSQELATKTTGGTWPEGAPASDSKDRQIALDLYTLWLLSTFGPVDAIRPVVEGLMARAENDEALLLCLRQLPPTNADARLFSCWYSLRIEPRHHSADQSDLGSLMILSSQAIDPWLLADLRAGMVDAYEQVRAWERTRPPPGWGLESVWTHTSKWFTDSTLPTHNYPTSTANLPEYPSIGAALEEYARVTYLGLFGRPVRPWWTAWYQHATTGPLLHKALRTICGSTFRGTTSGFEADQDTITLGGIALLLLIAWQQQRPDDQAGLDRLAEGLRWTQLTSTEFGSRQTEARTRRTVSAMFGLFSQLLFPRPNETEPSLKAVRFSPGGELVITLPESVADGLGTAVQDRIELSPPSVFSRPDADSPLELEFCLTTATKRARDELVRLWLCLLCRWAGRHDAAGFGSSSAIWLSGCELTFAGVKSGRAQTDAGMPDAVTAPIINEHAPRPQAPTRADALGGLIICRPEPRREAWRALLEPSISRLYTWDGTTLALVVGGRPTPQSAPHDWNALDVDAIFIHESNRADLPRELSTILRFVFNAPGVFDVPGLLEARGAPTLQNEEIPIFRRTSPNFDIDATDVAEFVAYIRNPSSTPRPRACQPRPAPIPSSTAARLSRTLSASASAGPASASATGGARGMPRQVAQPPDPRILAATLEHTWLKGRFLMPAEEDTARDLGEHPEIASQLVALLQKFGEALVADDIACPSEGQLADFSSRSAAFLDALGTWRTSLGGGTTSASAARWETLQTRAQSLREFLVTLDLAELWTR